MKGGLSSLQHYKLLLQDNTLKNMKSISLSLLPVTSLAPLKEKRTCSETSECQNYVGKRMPRLTSYVDWTDCLSFQHPSTPHSLNSFPPPLHPTRTHYKLPMSLTLRINE